MKPNSRRSPSFQAGFTLVEVMVGLGIGMLATVIIIQVISVFEAQRRTTTGTADAQTNGAIALYNIARELQMAGYPLVPVTDSPLECTTLTVNGAADTTTPNRLSPVSITDDVVGAGVNASPSDTITIRYGDSLMGGVPTQITSDPVGNLVKVGSNFGCKIADSTVITSGTTCAMSSATAVTGNVIGAMSVTLANTTGAVGGSTVNLACLGTWHEVTYRINGGNLERQDPTAIPNSFVPVVAGIVNLQVQYGVSAIANSNQVTQWVDASGATWSAPTVTVANRNRIKGVRIAVVARNAKMEQTAVTAACSSTTAAAPTGLCAWAGSVASPAPAIDLSTGDPNWQSYRYRVFDTIIPLRNMVWAKDTLL
jgi:type IV pilus assembly protein PilW